MKFLTILLLAMFTAFAGLSAAPKISFSELLERAERDPSIAVTAKQLAIKQGLPVNILTSERKMFDAKGVENGNVVYAVFTNLADVYAGGSAAFFDEITGVHDISIARIDYGNGFITDNTGGMFNPVNRGARGGEKYVMVPDWTFDRVYLFSAQNGDLIDTAFITYANPQLQSPKHALQLFDGRSIIVSDQISDVVQKFDTSGSYTGFYAPAGGPNTSILDNIRGIRFRSNRNLLVTVASGASMNTIQQFDTSGNHIGTFISANVNSPFDILVRQGDMLISNSSGANRITKFAHDGTFISAFYSSTNMAFPQQMIQLASGNIVVAGFSTPSGLFILDSTGNYLRTLTGVTGNRSAYLLGNGRYLTTNSAGVHEIDSATGALVRTIVTGANYQYASEYIPGLILSTGYENNISGEFRLYQNYPNPFNPTTTISFSIPEAGNISLKIYDQLGNVVASLAEGRRGAGYYSFVFDARALSSGVYYSRLSLDGNILTGKLALIK